LLVQRAQVTVGIGSLPLDVRRSLITPEADTPPASFDLP
jgi:hypothetical protein